MGCWHIVYQADMRARQEHLERCRREAADAHEQATTAGLPSTFDKDKPWETALRLLIKDKVFWQEELEEPCLLVLTKTHSLGSTLGGDAPISGPGQKPAAGKRPATGGDDGAHAKQPKLQIHNVGADGNFTCNRASHPLCQGF